MVNKTVFLLYGFCFLTTLFLGGSICDGHSLPPNKGNETPSKSNFHKKGTPNPATADPFDRALADGDNAKALEPIRNDQVNLDGDPLNNNQTPLDKAMNGLTAFVDPFLSKGLLLNSQDAEQHIPLYLAAAANQNKMVNFLFKKALSQNVSDATKMVDDALDLAEKNKDAAARKNLLRIWYINKFLHPTPTISMAAKFWESENKLKPEVMSKIKTILQKSEIRINRVGSAITNEQGTRIGEMLAQGGSATVFIIDDYPDLIFKYDSHAAVSDERNAELRASLAKTGQNILERSKLGLLEIANVEYFCTPEKGCRKHFVVEERFDIKGSWNDQKWIYDSLYEAFDDFPELKDRMQAIFNQLTIFVCKTGLWDLKYDNLPLLNSGAGIALIDIDSMKDPLPKQCSAEAMKSLFFGTSDSPEAMAAPELFDGMRKTAAAVFNKKPQDIVSDEIFVDWKNRKKQQMIEDKKMDEWHQKKGIVVGDEPVVLTPAQVKKIVDDVKSEFDKLSPDDKIEHGDGKEETIRKTLFNLIEKANFHFKESNSPVISKRRKYFYKDDKWDCPYSARFYCILLVRLIAPALKANDVISEYEVEWEGYLQF